MNKNMRIFFTVAVCAYFFYYASTYTEWHFIDNVNLIFHEAGHTIFFFLGHFIQVVMGSGFQVLLPLLISGYFFWQDQKLSAALCLLWVGQNILNVSVYTGDAIVMQLPLLGGDGAFHDWNYIFSTLGILKYTDVIAKGMYILGVLVIIFASALSVYYVVKEE